MDDIVEWSHLPPWTTDLYLVCYVREQDFQYLHLLQNCAYDITHLIFDF